MTIHKLNLGTLPDGVGGDTPRSGAIKTNANFGIDENGNYAPNENAASRLVGTNPGNVMEVGAFGLGATGIDKSQLTDIDKAGSGFYLYGYNDADTTYNSLNNAAVLAFKVQHSAPYAFYIGKYSINDTPMFMSVKNSVHSGWKKFYTETNTTTDSNGFIKAASPIVKLFADKIELNDEAQQQKITFEKLGVGDYLIKGSTGFSQTGWYIEMPKDANGNVLVAVVYKQLKNKDISVKTYAKMLDSVTGDVIPNTKEPRDIPDTRWIDIRLEELPVTPV